MIAASRLLLQPLLSVSVAPTVEYVMSMPLRVSDEIRAKVDAEVAAARAQEKADNNLTPSMQLALLSMRNTYTAEKIVEVLKNSTVIASGADYRELRQRGFCEMKPNGFHKLTPKGWLRADIVARTVARELGILTITPGQIRMNETWFRHVSRTGW